MEPEHRTTVSTLTRPAFQSRWPSMVRIKRGFSQLMPRRSGFHGLVRLNAGCRGKWRAQGDEALLGGSQGTPGTPGDCHSAWIRAIGIDPRQQMTPAPRKWLAFLESDCQIPTSLIDKPLHSGILRRRYPVQWQPDQLQQSSCNSSVSSTACRRHSSPQFKIRRSPGASSRSVGNAPAQTKCLRTNSGRLPGNSLSPSADICSLGW